MSEIKETVKEYFAFDTEIKASMKLLSQMRKKRKEREDQILTWMRSNGAMRIKTRHGNLERSKQSRKVTVNKERVETVARSFIADDIKTDALLRMIYEERPVQEMEILKPSGSTEADDGNAEETEDQ